jgi:bifunctional non-homologous end joining protein LigD
MLNEYRRKRNLTLSGEPAGELRDTGQHRFVVHEHHARNLHYDLRLEMNGALRSWAVPKGPSLTIGERRLAVQVEDHPVGYIDFEGTIPPGQYGAGTVGIWDKGTYEPQFVKEDEFEIFFRGEKLRGRYALVRMQNNPKNWLLIKMKEKEHLTTLE